VEQFENQGDYLVAPPGLAGVVVADTSIGDVRGDEGLYGYRGYSAVELARYASFEEAWHLLLRGHLPDTEELSRFTRWSADLRRVPESVARLLPELVPAGNRADPVLGLSAALAVLGSAECFPPLYGGPERRHSDAARLVAVTPALVAAAERLRRGESPIPPEPGLGHVANYLYMLTGTPPSSRHVDALSTYLILTVDHGFNASTFATRVLASTGTNLVAAVIAGLGALAGPLHGGAPSRVLDALDTIGNVDAIHDWVASTIASGERIMGFGHAIYRGPDPRCELLRGTALSLGGERAELAVVFEQEVVRQLRESKPERTLAANVELYAAIVMEQCGIPRHLFTPTFAIARMVGWVAHALEQAEQRKIIRPSSRYVGPEIKDGFLSERRGRGLLDSGPRPSPAGPL
jgi:citrate synthase